jgi:hypothetical protein
MALCNGAVSQEQDCDDSEISTTSSEPDDDFLSRYTLSCSPEKWLKLRGRHAICNAFVYILESRLF